MLSKEFALKDLEDLYFFLGIKVHNIGHGLFLNQARYARDVLAQVNMTHSKAAPTTLSSSEKITAHEGDLLGLMIVLNTEVWLVHYNM